MSQLVADKRDIDFVLYEQMDTETLLQRPPFEDLDKKTINLIINEARGLALKEIQPTNAVGDKEGVRFSNGEVFVPECYHRPFKLILEGEWTSPTEDPEYGGQGLPYIVAKAINEYMYSNYVLYNYGMMGHGTGKMVEMYGSELQKKLFLKKLYSGEWGGTMLLTETMAGSDVGAVETRAVPNDDGTFSLYGSKIFITNGEHNLSENIIHPVLARLEGAPAGTSGISIFLVPKIWVNEDGSLGERNDVVCTGVEEKMGIHGSATCSMSIGSKGTCRGLLLGLENEGMKIMFHMMNDARLIVGFQGFSYASGAYLAALGYARERFQGKDLAAGGKSPSVAIINHPDIRRMLLWMKAHVDGMRSLNYYVGRCFDIAKTSDNEEERSEAMAFTDLLTPVVKAYCSQRGYEVCSMGVLVFGGYGYTSEYPAEQYVRDCRITSIYEGTDGIQAIDLLARKLGMNSGNTFLALIEKMKQTIIESKQIPELANISSNMEQFVDRYLVTASKIAAVAGSDQLKIAYANAYPFLFITGDIIIAWMLLWRAVTALKNLKSASKKDVDFYRGQIKTAEFFIITVLPETMGKIDAIMTGNDSVVNMSDSEFASA